MSASAIIRWMRRCLNTFRAASSFPNTMHTNEAYTLTLRSYRSVCAMCYSIPKHIQCACLSKDLKCYPLAENCIYRKAHNSKSVSWRLKLVYWMSTCTNWIFVKSKTFSPHSPIQTQSQCNIMPTYVCIEWKRKEVSL